MARVTITVEMKNIYSYEAPAYGYGYETKYIYTMQGEDGTVYVWKTTAFMGYEVEDPNGWIHREKKGKEVIYRFDNINKGDVVKITATIKGQGEYKGQPQTELTRVKVVERTIKAKTPDEIRAEKQAEQDRLKKEQLDSIKDGDMVWEMPYKQYKDHYDDCETVIDSFTRRNDKAYIKVIIREGRLKASGVRGERFKGYAFTFTLDGKRVQSTFRAVCEENALKQLHREFKGATNIEAGRIYDYSNMGA